MRPLHILALSDEVDGSIYTTAVRERFGHVDLVLGCGDLGCMASDRTPVPHR